MRPGPTKGISNAVGWQHARDVGRILEDVFEGKCRGFEVYGRYAADRGA